MRKIKQKTNYKAPSIEEKILGDHRFLDIRCYIRFDFSIFSSETANEASNADGIPKYKEFKQASNSKKSGFAQAIHNAYSRSKTHKNLDDLSNFSQFLLQLPKPIFKPDLIFRHIEKFKSYAHDCIKQSHIDAQSIISLGLPALISPIHFWVGQMDKKQREDLVLIFEEIIRNLNRSSVSPASLSGAVEFNSYLIFAYIAISELCEIGTASTTLTHHLLYFRKQSISSWLNLQPAERLQYAVIALILFLKFFKTSEKFQTRYGFSHNTFGDLHALFGDAYEVCTQIGLATAAQVFLHLVERIESEALSLNDLSVGRRALKGLTQGEKASVVELIKRFSSYRIPITAERLEKFLVQFKTTQRIRAAIKLLSHLKFYPLWQLGESIEGLLSHEAKEFGKLVVAPLGDRTGSTAIINYLISHSAISNITFADDISHALKLTRNGDRIYFVDDCALSGTQSIHIMQELMGERDLKPHHTKHCDPLSIDQQEAICNRTLVFTYCLACDIAIARMQEEISKIRHSRIKFEMLYGIPEPAKAKAFSTASPIPWETPEERDDLKNFCATIGYEILEGIAITKKWTDDRRAESSLGFSDFQRLLVFPYSAPKTSLPVLWLKHNSTSKWMPLFPTSE